MSTGKNRISKIEYRKLQCILIIALLCAGAVRSFAQTVPPREDEAKLIAVLTSDDASHKEKVDACRGLALIGTSEAIAPLASLLGDEKLSHMARYGLEPIQDPAVDEAFREALGRLTGRPLVGVIGSLGVRRDTNAVEALKGMLRDPDVEVAQATARALGSIGNAEAAAALQGELGYASGVQKLHVCEGLFRCAETAAAGGQTPRAIAIYDQLRKLDGPHQVRGGALRGAILARGGDAAALVREYMRSDDYILFSAACQATLELPGGKVTRALTAELNELSADNEILVIWTLGKRGDATALPALFGLAKEGERTVRVEAIRALPQIDHVSALPVLVELLDEADAKIGQAAQESLAALSGDETDAAIMAMLETGRTEQRLVALELMGRRRMTKNIPALLKAAGGNDAKVRPAAIRKIGELGSIKDLPALLDVLMQATESQDLNAAERALSAVCIKTDNPQSQADRLIRRLARAQPEQKAALLHVLGIVGGPEALSAVRAAADDSNGQVSDAAIRALCSWKTADAAPDLLALARTSPMPSRKTAALRGYISLVRDESLSTRRKLAMCRQATELVRRNEDKKLLLGVLGTVPSPAALAMAMAHLDDRATRVEASFAAVAISEKIVDQESDKVIEALQKVLNATDNRNVTRSARATLGKARKAVRR
ncbi:MAG: HEAT repeat domain-containing protein [Planctomycetota bacterium]